MYGLRLENVSGNYNQNARNLTDCFYVEDAEDSSNCFTMVRAIKNCMDYSHFGAGAERLYECQSCGDDVFSLIFCRDCWYGNSNLIYCASCYSCSDCFGCAGLRKKQYCILNRQFSKNEYEQLVPRIIEQMAKFGEWGEFFPIEASPFPYNLSFAQRYFPFTQAECLKNGLQWYDKESVPSPSVIKAADLPDRLPAEDTPLVISSSLSGRNFSVSSQELKRLFFFGAPLPRETYDERMEARFARLGGIKLFERRCDKTGVTIFSTHPSDSDYPVWEKEAYEREFV